MKESEPGLYGTPGRVEQEVATVQAIYAAFARRDVEAALEWVGHECEIDLPGTAELAGRTDPYRGHDGVRQYFADLEKLWADLTIHADDIRASAGGVVVFGHVDGVQAGGRVSRRVLWLWQVQGGKAVHVRANDLGEADDPA